MFNIEFYSTIDGASELWLFLDDIQKKPEQTKMPEFNTNRLLYISSYWLTMEHI